MRFTRKSAVVTAALASTAALSLSLLSPATAASHRPASSPSVTQRHAAQNALDAVQRALGHAGAAPGLAAGKPGRDLTLLMAQLVSHLDDLGPADRRTAERILARPTDNGGDNVGGTVEYNHSLTVNNDCGAGDPGAGSTFCVNWVSTSSEAPATTDTNGTQDGDGIPDYIETVRSTMQNVWNTEVGAMGYKAPLHDRRGVDNRLDIYIADLGDQGLYGYCVPEAPNNFDPSVSGWDLPGYCVLDNDYVHSQFPSNTPTENLQVTAAHEFFHAVQFAYDFAEDPWFMEGTAAWMEDQVYDNVNDNYQYLQSSPLTKPSRPLDHSATIGVYGSWIWWRFLSEWYDPNVVKQVWQHADDATNPSGNRYSMKAVDAVIKQRGDTLASDFSVFGAINRAPETFYEEGAGYPSAPAARTFTLGSGAKTSRWQSLVLNHMANGTVAVKPGSGAGTGWKLKINVDGPARAHQPFVTLAWFAADGSLINNKTLKLDRSGVGSANAPFDGSTVDHVDVTLTNAGHAFKCWKGTQFSCMGKPLDDGQRFNYMVTAVRP